MVGIGVVLVLCMLCRVDGLLPIRLNLQEQQVTVTATSTCEDGEQYVVCSVNDAADDECLRTCGNGGHEPELSIDRKFNTSWQSNTAAFYESRAAVSDGTTGLTVGELPLHSLIIDMKQTVHIVEVRVYSGEGVLPSLTSLYGSLDGNMFSLISSSVSSAQRMVALPVVNVSGQQQDLTMDQKENSLFQFLRIDLEPPLEPLVNSDLRSAFYSVSEVELFGVCPSSLESTPESTPECYGSPSVRRTFLPLENINLHRLLWQRSNQSEPWILDDVILIDDCPQFAGEQCRVRNNFNDTSNSILWDSMSFSATIGSFSCSDSNTASLLILPGDQIISQPLNDGISAIQFGVEFPYPTPLCRESASYNFPVELRQCRSIAGVLGDCELIALVSPSECGNCLDKLIFELRHMQEELETASFPANLTILSVLHDDIHSNLDRLEVLKNVLTVLEVTTGVLASLPPSPPPPTSVLNLLLVPSITEKVEDLMILLEDMPVINVIMRDDLIQFYSDSVFQLETILTEAIQIRYTQRRLATDVSVLLRSVSEKREAVTSVQQRVAMITELLSNRQYTNTINRASSISLEVKSLLEATQLLFEQTQNNTVSVLDLSSSLMAVSIPLRSISVLVSETLNIAREAFHLFQIAVAADSNLTDLLQEAESGLNESEMILNDVQDAIINGGQIITQIRDALENTTKEIPAVNLLIDQLNQTVQALRPNLNQLPMFTCSSGRDNCTEGEEYAAQLYDNFTTLVNSSVSIYTQILAFDTLSSIGNVGKPLDLQIINETALRAQEEASETISLLNATTVVDVSYLVVSAELLTEITTNNINITSDLSMTVTSVEERAREVSLTLDNYRNNLTELSERVRDVELLEEMAIGVSERVNITRETIEDVGDRVDDVRPGINDIRDDINEITTNVEKAETVLQETQQKFPLVSRVLEATRTASEAAISNISDFLRENQRIVSDIDSIINSLSDIHANIALINSPIRLSSQPSLAGNTTIPYLSLQPPSGRQLEGGVQFEDLELYLWPSEQYQSPSLIFYAGPVRYPHLNVSEETNEDVVWVIAENDQLRLGWELGGYHGNTTYPGLLEGESQLRLMRVGSQFQLQFSPSSSPALQTSLSQINNSILFHSSSRTAFLLGGWPLGSKLGSEVRPLPQESLSGFEGQYQLALFNGGLWGLWNVRGASQTDLIGNQEFRRNDFTRGVTWHATTSRIRTTSVLSFDGLGYLFTQQFGTVSLFGGSFFQTITLYLRPNDASRGLVLYAYQTEISLSLEVAFRAGQVNVLISLHTTDTPEVLVNHTSLVSLSGNGEMELGIRYVPGNRRYTINSQNYDLPASTARFFTNLRQVKAWFGGFRDGLFESSYTPHEKTGYFGCVDMEAQRFFTIFEVFRGPSFTEYYLNSQYQSRLSATCYSTVYVREVSFSAEANGLEYSYLPLPPLSSTCVPTLPLSLSLSLLPLDSDGVVIAARDQESSVLVRLENGLVIATVSVVGSSITVSSQTPILLETWHTIFISITTIQELQLFVDGILRETIQFTLTGFSLNLPTSIPVGVVSPQPVLFIGGIPTNSSLPSFIGCMRDVTFDLCPLTFQSQALIEQYPLGVTYHSCPSSIVTEVPQLPVQPAPPQQRVCLGAGPVEIGSTHGGFVRDTILETSNIAGLCGRGWSLTFDLRQRVEGHVITVKEVFGGEVTVELERGGVLVLSVTSALGEIDRAVHSTTLPFNIFSSVNVSCSVNSSLLYCQLSVEDTLPVITQVSYNSTIFDPILPITLGMTTDLQGNTVNGFEGCISNLAINGNTTGFQGVETNIPCYNKTVTGLGFTGTSSIKETLPSLVENREGVSVVMRVRPLLETGVVLVLTTYLSSTPELLIQLVQGQLQVMQRDEDINVLGEGLCNSTSEDMVFEVAVNYTASQLSVSLIGGSSIISSSPPSLSQEVDLIVGRLPGDDRAPGLVGCVVSLLLQGQPLNLSSVAHTNIINGFCPDN